MVNTVNTLVFLWWSLKNHRKLRRISAMSSPADHPSESKTSSHGPRWSGYWVYCIDWSALKRWLILGVTLGLGFLKKSLNIWWWLEHEWFLTFHFIYGIIFPIDELHHFSGGLVETTNQTCFVSTTCCFLENAGEPLDGDVYLPHGKWGIPQWVSNMVLGQPGT